MLAQIPECWATQTFQGIEDADHECWAVQTFHVANGIEDLVQDLRLRENTRHLSDGMHR